MRLFSPQYAWLFDVEKEEEWLEEISGHGRQLVRVGRWLHDLEDCAPGEYSYRIELLKKSPRSEESRRYIEFLEDTGAEYIGSRGRWAYFKKKSSPCGFELFSDIDSRIEHLGRILRLDTMVLVSASIALPICLFAAARMPSLGIYNCTLFVLFVAATSLYGCIKFSSKKRRLETERVLRE